MVKKYSHGGVSFPSKKFMNMLETKDANISSSWLNEDTVEIDKISLILLMNKKDVKTGKQLPRKVFKLHDTLFFVELGINIYEVYFTNRVK
jgi:hypothetical protein